MIPAGFDPFEALTNQRREALAHLIRLSQKLREGMSFLPEADSPAMTELTSEAGLSAPAPWGNRPVTDALNVAVLFLTAAEDHLLAVCRLLAHEEPTVYGHVALVRAALENASRAYLIAEAGIGPKRRVGRLMTERLYSAGQLLDLPGIPAAAKAHVTARRNGILAEGDRLGFKKVSKKGQPPALEEERSSSRAAIKRLVAENDPQLGGLLYGVQSAITHGTLYGLLDALEKEAAIEEPMSGEMMTAPLAARADRVNSLLTAAAIGYINALMAVYGLHAWRSDDWEAAAIALVQTARNSPGG